MPATPAWPPRSAPRLFVPGPLAEGAEVALDGQQAHYLAKVMRVAAGDAVVLCDDRTGEWTARVAAVSKRDVVLVAEARTGLFDERGYNRPNLPAGRLAEVVGAIELEAPCSDPDNRPPLNNPTGEGWPDPIYNGPPIEITDPLAATLRAHQ